MKLQNPRHRHLSNPDHLNRHHLVTGQSRLVTYEVPLPPIAFLAASWLIGPLAELTKLTKLTAKVVELTRLFPKVLSADKQHSPPDLTPTHHHHHHHHHHSPKGNITPYDTYHFFTFIFAICAPPPFNTIDVLALNPCDSCKNLELLPTRIPPFGASYSPRRGLIHPPPPPVGLLTWFFSKSQGTGQILIICRPGGQFFIPSLRLRPPRSSSSPQSSRHLLLRRRRSWTSLTLVAVSRCYFHFAPVLRRCSNPSTTQLPTPPSPIEQQLRGVSSYEDGGHRHSRRRHRDT